MDEILTEYRDRTGLAFSAQRYHDVITISKNYLKENFDIPPNDRSLLYEAYRKLIVDVHFKSYWKLISMRLTEKFQLNYLEKIENEIDYFSDEIVKLIDCYFLASKSNRDLDIIVTLRLRADFLFYNSAISRPMTRQILLQSALRSYTEGVERSRLTLPIDETERVLIYLRKCSCEIQLSNGFCHPNIYEEYVNTQEELKTAVSTVDHPLVVQMENYRLELEKLSR